MPAVPSVEEVIDPAVLSKLTLGKVLSFVLLFVVCILAMKLVLKAVSKLLGKSKLDTPVQSIIVNGLKTIIIFIIVIIMAESLGIKMSSFVALLSIVGLAASLALQDSLSNMASGMVILVTKPFKIGDYVTIGSLSGNVTKIGLTATKLLTPDNQAILLPNKTITASSVCNYSSEETRRLDFKFTASYDAPTDTVKEALLEAVDIPQVMEEPAPFIKLSGYGDSAIEYTVRVWVKSSDYWDAHFEIMERVRQSFDKRNVEMTYPHLNVHALS